MSFHLFDHGTTLEVRDADRAVTAGGRLVARAVAHRLDRWSVEIRPSVAGAEQTIVVDSFAAAKDALYQAFPHITEVR